MANYYLDSYNNLIDHAREIYEFLDGSYMNRFENMTVDCHINPAYIINGMKFVRIEQYRKLSSDQDTVQKIRFILKGALESYHNAGCSVGYFIVSHGNSISVFFASDANANHGFDANLGDNVPNVKTKNQFIGRTELRECSYCGGIISGITDIDEPVVDGIINSMKTRNCILGIIAMPFTKAKSEQYRQALRTMSELCADINSYEKTFGYGTKRTVAETFPDVTRLKEVLDNEEKRLAEVSDGLWQSCIWFAGENKEDAEILGESVISAFGATKQKASQKFRKYLSTVNPFSEGVLFIPDGIVRRPAYEIDNSLVLSPFVSLVSSKELAGYMQVPLHSFNGIRVISTEHDQDDIYEYDTVSTVSAGVQFGRISDSMLPYNISLQELVNHLLVVGGTGAGKTNTVMNLLQSAYKNNIPFCIIESAKKEYWKLATTVNNLRVYSSGRDAIDLKLNPLAPEEGVYIGNHVDDLIYAFCGAFDMETPTKAALQNLLVYTYKKYGWDTADIAFNGAKSYPTIKDMLHLLPQFCESELTYGNEVGSNIQGAISNRLHTLINGPVGDIVNCEKGIPARELCSKNTLVELDDLSISVRPFIANLLVVKLNQYLRQKDVDGNVRNLIVIEEAHNIFSEVHANGLKTSKDLASEYFSNLLSEIRAFGTAMAIIDQCPSQINANAISNTALKIVHALNSKDDADSIAYALNLTDYQKRQLANLETGEAVIGRRGDRNVCKVKVDLAHNIPIDNLACLFCGISPICKDRGKTFINDQTAIDLFATRLYNMRFDASEINREMENIARECGIPLEQRRCLLGYLLSKARINCSDREKRRILYSLKREG